VSVGCDWSHYGDNPLDLDSGTWDYVYKCVEAVQNTIDLIKLTTNITGIAATTHVGYEEDQKLAAAVSGLQLFMIGHSQILLGDLEGATGKYPTIVKNKDGDEVFIVTA
jgi:2',3'-cyclic-nucleotide 2'-phosphodiesterase (5'-nucleotidase family)